MKHRFSEIKTISLRTINILMAVVAGLVSLFLLYVAWLSHSSFNIMVDSTEKYIASQRHAATLLAGSDYLTEEVLAFVVTGDKIHADRYFNEVFENKRRDKALQELELYFATSGAYSHLKKALDRSNALMDHEYRSMRLTIESTGQDVALYPKELQNYQLDRADQKLSPEQKKTLSRELLVGQEYHNAKEKIRNEVSKCIDLLVLETQNKQEESSGILSKVMRLQFSLIAVLLVILLLFIVATSMLIVRPLRRGADLIFEQREMPEDGAYEVRYFAKTYNTLFRQNQEHRRKLTYEAEHDALTGLFNRVYFERIRFTHEQRSIALLAIDVDHFKQVNDTFGHDTGDKVLKKVAHLLMYSFREEDFIFRIGGDEFAVIMVYAKSDLKDVIERKIKLCNSELNHPSDGLPKVSLSVGVAFSDRSGSTGDIYKDADTALYAVKARGRNGIAFYSAELARSRR